MNQSTIDKITMFLKEVGKELHNDITDYIEISDIDLSNSFESISELMQDNNGFDVEITYYAVAMEYLIKNDNSLTISLGLAAEIGYTSDNLNSEILASLLASENERETFTGLESEITEFFESLEIDSE
jgi:hypothetical protein